MKSCEVDRATGRRGHALCCRYVVARFASIRTSVVDEAASSTSLMWAVGTFVDGEHELLGAWLVPCEDGSACPEVLGDLWARGAERIEWAVVLDGTTPPAATIDAPGPRVVHWHHGCPLTALNVVLPPRARRILTKADAVAQSLQASMTRVARRRGGQFESAESAFACLGRLWRRLDRRLAAEATGHAPRAPRPSSRTSAAGGAPAR